MQYCLPDVVCITVCIVLFNNLLEALITSLAKSGFDGPGFYSSSVRVSRCRCPNCKDRVQGVNLLELTSCATLQLFAVTF